MTQQLKANYTSCSEITSIVEQMVSLEVAKRPIIADFI
jgi:hypothetical protein